VHRIGTSQHANAPGTRCRENEVMTRAGMFRRSFFRLHGICARPRKGANIESTRACIGPPSVLRATHGQERPSSSRVRRCLWKSFGARWRAARLTHSELPKGASDALC
jgi:hypothetical protein